MVAEVWCRVVDRCHRVALKAYAVEGAGGGF